MLILSGALAFFQSSSAVHAVHESAVSVVEQITREDGGYTERRSRMEMRVSRSATVSPNVPLHALHTGLDLRSTGTFVIETTEMRGAVFRTTTTVSNMVRSEMGVTIGNKFNNVNTKFIAEHSHTFAQTLTIATNAVTLTRQEHTIAGPQDFGFRTFTLYAYEARWHHISITYEEFTRYYQTWQVMVYHGGINNV